MDEKKTIDPRTSRVDWGDGAPGRKARRPGELSGRAWWRILKRVWNEVNDDRVLLIAAGATYYLLLALFPALAAFVSIYGFVADPRTIAEHVAFLGGMLPRGGLDIISNQLNALASQDREALSIGFVSGLVIALWSANSGVKALFDAMNIAYDETEKRGFIRLNLWSGFFTLGAILIGVVLMVSVGVVPAVLALLRLGPWTETIISLARWPLMLVFIWLGIALMYRYGPSRERAKWRWLTWGATLATVVWVVVSAGFSYYLQNFADYNATYGSLGAVIGFMIWVWLSVTILIVGAELNSEMEHQTAVDSTTGPPQPMGERGAHMADHVAKS
ncbi:YihY/virulence factor BrkB family protein [Arvimicrobium flavum]|uniref:YihY/virulence factor BrkB family protein n=1 Tax=Arvimicrobium flavum TaxID=3393320 RepID=UPI00237B2B52|nr:YihY/virulence factor BrkB family protein [Mesorhizobium shangrilense]